MSNGDVGAATIHFVAQRDGTGLAMDGVIVEVWLFGADQSTEDAFWRS
jgi:hypothetical protein